MKSKDLEYIYSNIPYKEMNKYKSNITINTIRQYIKRAKKLGFNYNVKDSVRGHKAIELLRKDGTTAGILKNPIYPSNSNMGRIIAKDKFKTENVLKKRNLHTTNSFIYNIDEMEKAKQEAYSDSNRGIVIKPLDMSLGKGVFVNVAEQEFEYYWNLAKEEILKAQRTNKSILVQDFLEGFEARAVILEGKFISIVARVPAFIIGDGEKTIEKLIIEKNAQRSECGHLKNKPIKPDRAMESFLGHSGLSFSSVPGKGEYVLLISVSNTTLGGEMVDITELVSTEIKELALNALASLPDMYCGGVDIMMTDFNDTNPAVIEINPFPLLQSTIYPTYGPRTNPQDYFLNAFYAKDQLVNNVADEYEIENEKEYLKNYLMFQDRQQRMQSLQYANV